ncbi:lasso peptide biosynthesis B2 protein [Candidatus Zixiibacteriota bacterium]
MRSLTDRIGTFSRLTFTEQALFIRSWISFILVDLQLRFISSKQLLDRESGGRSGTGRIPEDETEAFISRTAWLVERAGRFAPVRSTCLKESLILHRILDRHQISSDLRIGVLRTNGELQAHAWLERNGVPIFGYDPEDGYQPLAPA